MVIKEWFYHYTMRRANQLRSKLLEANASHSRSDALSTVAVLAGLVGAQLGHGWVDVIAAIVVAAPADKAGVNLPWESSREFIDTALPAADQLAMYRISEQVLGVKAIHELRSRTLGGKIVLELHIVVSPRITVAEGHATGSEVCRRLRQRFTELSHLTFHIAPEKSLDAPQKDYQSGDSSKTNSKGTLAT